MRRLGTHAPFVYSLVLPESLTNQHVQCVMCYTLENRGSTNKSWLLSLGTYFHLQPVNLTASWAMFQIVVRSAFVQQNSWTVTSLSLKMSAFYKENHLHVQWVTTNLVTPQAAILHSAEVTHQVSKYSASRVGVPQRELHTPISRCIITEINLPL